MALTFKGGFGPATGAYTVNNGLTKFQYLNTFDLSTTGSGTYSNSDSTVTNIDTFGSSYPTFPAIQNTTNEVRLKWTLGGSLENIDIHIKDSVHSIANWWSGNDNFAYRNTSLVYFGDTAYTGSLHEIRINTITGVYELYVDGLLVVTKLDGKVPVGNVYAIINEGSASKTTVNLLS